MIKISQRNTSILKMAEDVEKLPELDNEDDFDRAQARYWWLTDHHGGQFSPEYKELCSMDYKPAISESKPTTPEAAELYNDMCSELGCEHEPLELPGYDYDSYDNDTSEDEETDNEADDVDSALAHKYNARLEAANPHAAAAKELFNERRELLQQLHAIDKKLAQHREVLFALDPSAKHEAYADDKEMRKWLKVDKNKPVEKKKRKKVKAELVEKVLKAADVLDARGDYEGVKKAEELLHKFTKYASIAITDHELANYEKILHAFAEKVLTEQPRHRDYPEVSKVAPSMSTRNCPDHHGIQLMNVGDGVYQCELDGKLYNWNEGFKSYDGIEYAPSVIHTLDIPEGAESIFQTRTMAIGNR